MNRYRSKCPHYTTSAGSERFVIVSFWVAFLAPYRVLLSWKCTGKYIITASDYSFSFHQIVFLVSAVHRTDSLERLIYNVRSDISK